MPKAPLPVLSVIVRRFRQEFSDDIENSIKSIQDAVADQPGFIGLQNSLSPKHDGRELVTVITFDTLESLHKWEASPIRQRLAKDLDKLSQGDATNTKFGDLSVLVHSGARVSKAETVVVLIIWILVLSSLLRYPLDYLLPDSIGPFGQRALQTTVIVVLISYVFLPFSSIVLTRAKARFARMRRKR